MFHLPDLDLPGRFAFRLGAAHDYRRLASLHYNRRGPATFALVGALDYVDGPSRRTIGVGVLSYPTLRCFAREEALKLQGVAPELRTRFLNRHLRTISRVIVHPQFRGIGLSGFLVRQLCLQCPTRYVEAIAKLATFHPLFDRGGMKCLDNGDAARPAYYLWSQN